jgi:single-stranded DNA-binding protein
MSARGYNKCIELGNLTADPELKHTSTGTAFTTFRIAVTRAYGNNGHSCKTKCQIFHRPPLALT